MYKLKLFNDPFISDLFGLVNETPRIVNGSIKRSNTKETDNEYLLDIAVPGLTKDDVSVKVVDSILTISHEKEEDGNNFYFTSSFKKEFTLPDDVNIKDVSATVENGVLSITLPKDKKKVKELTVKIL